MSPEFIPPAAPPSTSTSRPGPPITTDSTRQISARPRRGVRRWVPLFVVLGILVVLAGGFFVADTITRDRVEDQVSVQLQKDLMTPDVPAVQIHGFPFLTQLLFGTIGQATVTANDLGTTGDGLVPVAGVMLEVTDVVSTDGFKTMIAGHIEGTATMDYSAFRDLAGVAVSYAGGGRVQMDIETKVLGASVKAHVTGRPEVDVKRQSLTLADPKIRLGGVDIPELTSKALLTTLVKPTPITGLPYDLRVTSVTPGEEGVNAGIQGDNVPLSG